MCSIILAIVLIITAALSATALLACRYQFWTFLQDASVSPVYTLRLTPSLHLLDRCVCAKSQFGWTARQRLILACAATLEKVFAAVSQGHRPGILSPWALPSTHIGGYGPKIT